MSAARREPQGPTPDPAVQKLRVRYAKRGRMRFTSSRDFQRALERALRLAEVPMAYSAGFHPHPKISYANAAPTSVASEAEYVELSLTRALDPTELRAALQAALPVGLDIVEVVAAQPGALADQLQASAWELVFTGVPLETVERAVQAFLGQASVEVTRMMKQGPRAIDVRGPVVSAQVRLAEAGPEPTTGALTTAEPAAGEPASEPAAGEPAVVLLLTVRHTTPTVRPAELWTALVEVSGQALPRPRSSRLAQGPLAEDGSIGDPLSSAPGSDPGKPSTL